MKSTVDSEYETVCIRYIGFVDSQTVEGVSVFQTSDGRQFHMRAFPGDVVRHVAAYATGKGEQIPSIYHMMAELCDMTETVLSKVKIYESGRVLRANLHFEGRRSIVLRNYRASDAMALAAYVRCPIMVRSTLLRMPR